MNDELRGFLATMNNELDSKDEELTELALTRIALLGLSIELTPK